MEIGFLISAFIAGMLTFFAPCTLPLVPGFLGFLSGVQAKELHTGAHKKAVRKKILTQAGWYIAGFSLVFILLGTVFGIGGIAFAEQRVWLSRIGGVIIIFFGLYMMNIVRLPFLRFLAQEKRFHVHLTPGKPLSAFVLGMTFSLGWSPCVGPVLGSILVLASTGSSVWYGTILLSLFSLGLALPFLLLAHGLHQATTYMTKLQHFLPAISFVGGLFLVFLGLLLLYDSIGMWHGLFYGLYDT